MISGLLTAILMVVFFAIAAWAWSSRNRARFADAAKLPLQESGDGSHHDCCAKHGEERRP